MSPNDDQFKLDTFSLQSNRSSRPTIPYSQFPRPQIRNISSAFGITSQPGNNEPTPNVIRARDAIQAAADSDSDMDGGNPSGHRRRTSNHMNRLDGSSRGQQVRPRRTPGAPGHDGLMGETKWSEDERQGSGEDSKSTSEDHELADLSDDNGLQDDEETGLTGAVKSKRGKRRRKNTLLDQRIVGSDEITKEEKKEADQHVVKKMLINVLLIGLWYLFSLSISIYNKWMFSPGNLDFPFPLFTTCVHMLVQFSLAALVLFLFPRLRPRYDSISNPNNTYLAEIDRVRHDADDKKPLMTRWFYLTRLGPCGLATGLDIGLGNMSLKFITLTFYTMCKSSALAFVLLFAFLFRLEAPSWRLVAIIAIMTIGVITMTFGETDFSALGFVLIISAAFFSGFRWGLTQILLLRNPATSNPFSSIFYLAPIMFLSLLIIAIPVEGFGPLFARLSILMEKKGTFLGPAILLFPGVIAFCMTASEFALLQRTSVVTLSIAGIFKEVVTILAAGRVFDDTLSPLNISGLFITIGAIAAYNYFKITKMRREARVEVHAQHHAVGTDSGSDADEEEGGSVGTGSPDADDAWDTQDVSGGFTVSDADVMPRRSGSLKKKGKPAAGPLLGSSGPSL